MLAVGYLRLGRVWSSSARKDTGEARWRRVRGTKKGPVIILFMGWVDIRHATLLTTWGEGEVQN